MKQQSKWILPAICACAGFVAGLATGISILEYKKKVSFKRLQEDINEEISETIEDIYMKAVSGSLAGSGDAAQ